MPHNFETEFDAEDFKHELEADGIELGHLPASMFEGFIIYTAPAGAKDVNEYLTNPYATVSDLLSPSSFRDKIAMLESSGPYLRFIHACNTARFAGARMVDDMVDKGITHVLVGEDRAHLQEVRTQLMEYVVVTVPSQRRR